MCGSKIIKRPVEWFGRFFNHPGRLTTLLDRALEAALVNEDMFLDNGRPDGSTRKRHVVMVSVPGQKAS